MWLEKLKELKKSSKMSSAQIAEATHLPESTIKRIFSGDTDNPYVDTLRRIVTALGGSLDDLFAESKLLVADTNLLALQAERDKLKEENSTLQKEIEELKALLFHFNESIEHKDEMLAQKQRIIELQEEIIQLQKYPGPNNVLKF